MKNEELIGNLVALEMNKISNSTDHSKLFYKKASECSEDCDCEKCKESKKDKNELISEATNLILEASEILEKHNLKKASKASIVILNNSLNKLAQLDSNDIKVKELLDPSSKTVTEEPFSMEQSLEELESDPDYELLDKVLSNKTLTKQFDKEQLHDRVEEELEQLSLDNYFDSSEDKIDEFLSLENETDPDQLNLDLPESEMPMSDKLSEKEAELLDLLDSLSESENLSTDKTQLSPTLPSPGNEQLNFAFEELDKWIKKNS